jgi:hypothetical protein
VSTLATHLEIDLMGEKPRFLTPLVTTAHTITVREHSEYTSTYDTESNDRMRKRSSSMEAPLSEPAHSDPCSIVQALPSQHKTRINWSSYDLANETNRRTIRKKAFNSLVGATQSDDDVPMFDMGKEYTFEFYQHLLILADPDDIKLSVAGVNLGISKLLNGQPIQILAGHKDPATGEVEPFWSFEIWHQALYPLAHATLSSTTEVV